MYKRLWAGRRGVFGHAARTVDEALQVEVQGWIQSEVERLFQSAPEAQSLRQLVSRFAEGPSAEAARRVAALGGFDDADAAVRWAVASGDFVPSWPLIDCRRAA